MIVCNRSYNRDALPQETDFYITLKCFKSSLNGKVFPASQLLSFYKDGKEIGFFSFEHQDNQSTARIERMHLENWNANSAECFNIQAQFLQSREIRTIHIGLTPDCYANVTPQQFKTLMKYIKLEFTEAGFDVVIV